MRSGLTQVFQRWRGGFTEIADNGIVWWSSRGKAVGGVGGGGATAGVGQGTKLSASELGSEVDVVGGLRIGPTGTGEEVVAVVGSLVSHQCFLPFFFAFFDGFSQSF